MYLNEKECFVAKKSEKGLKKDESPCSQYIPGRHPVLLHPAIFKMGAIIWSKGEFDFNDHIFFLQVSFAFMCTRLVQVITGSYAPMYLTDTLGFEKVRSAADII